MEESRTLKTNPRPRPLTDFLRTESGGAAVLLAATALALLWANSPFADGYVSFWGTELSIGWGDLSITEDLQHWVNDGLMAIFFFVVGLEVKRELVEGELRDPRAAALPVIAAIVGLALPAAIYLLFASGTEATAGWAIPVATDIAFALGILALLGDRIPKGLKVFLLTVAIADDIGAILIIAIAFSKGIDPIWLATAVGGLAAIAVMRRFIHEPWAYVPLALIVWIATLESGIHATLAGVALGLLTPTGEIDGRPILIDLEHRFHPISSYAVLPIFALANAGVVISGEILVESLTGPIGLGIVAGLVLGKSLGISAGVGGALASGIGRRPIGIKRRQLIAVAPLAGVGFTVSLFISDLAFDDAGMLAAAKIGVLVGSLLSGLLGAALLLAVTKGQGSAITDKTT
ncbi:MAG: Na+/H+ antiporter NhaA [Actinobacteria bacterium]|nr:MAG: Na+/H+ antiporter NhaA [Actinomycetota bacterium]REK40789.1 MAG: Na+/H+ antiporter NhaA [Actinomycetota bacterium]